MSYEDEVCKCGHREGLHAMYSRACLQLVSDKQICPCGEFTSTNRPVIGSERTP